MSKESEFSDKWQDFLKTVKSAILLDLRKKKKLDTSDLNNIIKAETFSWSNPNVSKGVYLQTLSRKNPELGEKFEQILSNLHCNEGTSIRNLNSLTVTSVMFGIAILILGLLNWGLSYDIKMSVGASILFLLVFTPIVSRHAEKHNQQNISLQVNEIIQDLDQQGDVLRRIVKEVE